MPIETLEDIVEEIADRVYVYGAEKRNSFVSELTSRIQLAVETERRLAIYKELLEKELIKDEKFETR